MLGVVLCSSSCEFHWWSSHSGMWSCPTCSEKPFCKVTQSGVKGVREIMWLLYPVFYWVLLTTLFGDGSNVSCSYRLDCPLNALDHQSLCQLNRPLGSSSGVCVNVFPKGYKISLLPGAMGGPDSQRLKNRRELVTKLKQQLYHITRNWIERHWKDTEFENGS